MTPPTIAVLAGGVGAAKLVRGLLRVVEATGVAVIVNTADDVVLHVLHVSPDLDTVAYTLAGEDNTELGWGLRGETWQAMQMLRRYGGLDWFNLGDRDLGTHLYRTHRLAEGAALSTVTAEIAAAWGIEAHILPVTDDRIETRVTVVDEGEIGFQEYFVRRHHDVAVTDVRVVGLDRSTPAHGVLEAIADADLVVVAPSNPIVSIGPVLGVPGVRDAVAARRDDCVAISPIVGGRAIKGPADNMLRELGIEPTAVGVAEQLRDLCRTFVIDEVDVELAGRVEALGMTCVVTDTIMSDAGRAAALAEVVLHACGFASTISPPSSSEGTDR